MQEENSHGNALFTFRPLGYHIDMPKTSADAERKRSHLRAFMKAYGLKPKSWAEEAGVNPNSIYNFLNGYSATLAHETYEKLADAVNVPSFVIDGSSPIIRTTVRIEVVGRVQAGDWQEALDWDADTRYWISAPVPNDWERDVFGLLVAGPSMDREYPPGSIVLCVKTHVFGRGLISGDHVIVQRRRPDGLIEATVKEYLIDDNGAQWLWPRSHDPHFQTPMRCDDGSDGSEHIQIIAIVIGSYRPRPNVP